MDFSGFSQPARHHCDPYRLGRALREKIFRAILDRRRPHQKANGWRVANISRWRDIGREGRYGRSAIVRSAGFSAIRSRADDAVIEYLQHAWFSGSQKLPGL